MLPIFLILSVGYLSVAGQFLNPKLTADPSQSTNPIWVIGETQQLEWITDLKDYTIFLWQQIGLTNAKVGGSIFSVLPDAGRVTDFNWTVNPKGFDLTESPVFFFWLVPNPTFRGDGNFTSHFVNLTTTPRTSSSSSTSISSTSSVTLSATSAASSTSTTTPATSLSASASPSPASGLPTSDKIGIGLGVPLGILVVAAGIAGIIWYFRRKASRERQAHVHGQPPPPEAFPKPEMPGGYHLDPARQPLAEMYTYQHSRKPSELDTRRPVVELG